jgi:hypothetical protein
MRRKLGSEGECEREGGEENSRPAGVFPALPFASATVPLSESDVYAMRFMTHAQHDKGKWKKAL